MSSLTMMGLNMLCSEDSSEGWCPFLSNMKEKELRTQSQVMWLRSLGSLLEKGSKVIPWLRRRRRSVERDLRATSQVMPETWTITTANEEKENMCDNIFDSLFFRTDAANFIQVNNDPQQECRRGSRTRMHHYVHMSHKFVVQFLSSNFSTLKRLKWHSVVSSFFEDPREALEAGIQVLQ